MNFFYRFVSVVGAGLLGGLAQARADHLYADAITVTGTIEQASASAGAPSVILPLTIANVFTVLGVSQDPAQFRYYYDDDTGGIVIGRHGVIYQDNVIPVVIIYQPVGFTFGTDYIGGYLYYRQPSEFVVPRLKFSLVEKAPLVLSRVKAPDLSSLKTTDYVTIQQSPQRYTAATKILAFGLVAGRQTIVSLKIFETNEF